MSNRCVFSCSHPVWGSEGTCVTTDGSGVEDSCVCDPGYASHDSLGRPSCVPRKGLLAAYMVLTVFMASAWVFSLWHLAQIRKLSSAARSTRKIVTRLRLIVAASVSHAGTLLVNCTAAARAGESSLLDNGMFYVLYITGLAPMFVLIASSFELKLESIPPQLVTPGGGLMKLKIIAVERNLFVWGGFVGMGAFSLLALSAIHFGVDTIRTTLNLIVMVGSFLQAMIFTSVAAFFTRAINSAASKAPQAWHAGARKGIRRQGTAYALACVIVAVAFAALELTRIGRSTPIIPLVVVTLVSVTGIDAFIHFTKPSEPGRGPGPPRSPPRRQRVMRPTVRLCLIPRTTFDSLLLSSRRGRASCPTTLVVVAGAHSGICAGDSLGGGELGATDDDHVGQIRDKHVGDDWPVAIGLQSGGKGKKVSPVI